MKMNSPFLLSTKAPMKKHLGHIVITIQIYGRLARFLIWVQTK